MFEEGPAGPAYTYQGMLRGRVKGGEREDWGGNREEEGQKEVPAPKQGLVSAFVGMSPVPDHYSPPCLLNKSFLTILLCNFPCVSASNWMDWCEREIWVPVTGQATNGHRDCRPGCQQLNGLRGVRQGLSASNWRRGLSSQKSLCQQLDGLECQQGLGASNWRRRNMSQGDITKP